MSLKLSFPNESAFTTRHDSQDFYDSPVWTPFRPPSGYIEVVSASPVELCSPSREKLLSDASEPVITHRQNSQPSSGSEQNAKQSASQKPIVHYLGNKLKLKMKTGVETKIEEEEAKFEKQAPVSAETGHFPLLHSHRISLTQLTTDAILLRMLFWAATSIVISWVLVAMSVDVIPVIIRILISLSWGHVESEEVKTRIELYNSVKDIFKPVLYAFSAWISWVILFENILHLNNPSSDVQSYAAYTGRAPFAFHRTAFRERLDELGLGLRVIEQLRNYKPRHRHRKSISHTPMFSARSLMMPFTEKDGFNFPGSCQHAEKPVHSINDGSDVEIEDKSRKGKGKHKPKESKALTNAQQDEEVVPPSSNESLHKRMIASLHDIHMRDGTVVAKHACRTSFAPLALQSKKIRYFFFIVHVKILQCVCTFDHEMPMMSQVASLPLK
ncbi:hypothetical protein SCLCIDRAFT_20757 [Scleroderma citrinum Foug A]|uniref:Mechanosensitive ion channel protein Msy1/2-like transmembrane domain-containing protein n=1 Tax=Scleroderma citrinum Foug A TaxID=1036808 RepID=A0A0C3A237_9AGAM|nr:hypothetical protein SCLCIDRAFT_20757 [Scleroderma citrinum Foug A]